MRQGAQNVEKLTRAKILVQEHAGRRSTRDARGAGLQLNRVIKIHNAKVPTISWWDARPLEVDLGDAAVF